MELLMSTMNISDYFLSPRQYQANSLSKICFITWVNSSTFWLYHTMLMPMASARSKICRPEGFFAVTRIFTTSSPATLFEYTSSSLSMLVDRFSISFQEMKIIRESDVAITSISLVMVQGGLPQRKRTSALVSSMKSNSWRAR